MLKNKIIAVIIVAISIVGCGKSNKTTEVKSPTIRPVKMVQVGSFTKTTERSFPATTRAKQEVQLSFRVPGPLVELNAEIGTSIKKGELIAEIDSRDYLLAVKSTKAIFEQSKAELERYEALLEKNAVPRNEYEIKRSKYQSAEVNYKNAQNALVDTKLIAPFDGYISEKNIENFQEVSAKQTIVSLVDLTNVEVQFSIPEQLRLQSDKFQSFSVSFDNTPNERQDADLINIGKSANPDGFPVTIGITSKDDIYESVGLNCRVYISIQENQEGIAIPTHAIYLDDETKKNRVWIVDKATMTVHSQEITHGNFLPDGLINIIDGLSNNDWIVIAGIANMKEGLKVKDILE